MGNKGLVKKISTGISVLALSALIGSGICYSKEINPQGYEIPDYGDLVQHLGHKHMDLTDKIEGRETRLDYYLIENQSEDIESVEITELTVQSIAFGYGVTTTYKQKDGKSPARQERYAIFDEDGDEIFETKYTEEEMNKKFMDGSVLPDWILR